MSQFVESPCRSLPCSGAIAQYLRVKLTGNPAQLAVAGVADTCLGTLEEASFVAGDMRAVRMRTAQGTRKFVAAGAIAAGAPFFAAAGGKVSATVNGNPEGFAIEAAAANNDVFEGVMEAVGQKVASGQFTTVSAADTVATGLNTVTSVVAILEADPGLDPALVTAQIGDQAGAPVAGSIIIKTWKFTSNANPTPLAATTFTKKVNWIAIGT
jgi:hypothetical protein